MGTGDTGGTGGIEWLDDEGRPAAPDEELPGQTRRPPLRRRTKIAFAAVAVAVLGAVVTVGVVARPDDAPRAKPRAKSERSTSPMAPATPTMPTRPSGPPASALAAIRAAFPAATLQSFVSVAGTPSTLFYNLSLSGRTVTVKVAPLRRTDVDRVARTASSIELGQQLGPAFIDIVVRRVTRRPSATDFDAMQDLVQDARLLTRQ